MHKYILLLILLYSCKEYRSTATDHQLIANLIDIPRITENTARIKATLQVDSIKKAACEGDIIFRGGTDVESNIIRDFSVKDKMFSHCGILLKAGRELMVTHILGGITNPKGTILHQSINEFLSYPENESAGIYHINLSRKELSSIHHFVDSVKTRKVCFDMRFNLFSKQHLYCTEFIIDALEYAKHTINFVPVSYDLKNTKYFFLCNKGNKFLFYPIDELQHHRYLEKKFTCIFSNYQPSVI